MCNVSREMLAVDKPNEDRVAFFNIVKETLLNHTCWHVNYGRVGAVFELAFEPKVRRKIPLTPSDYSDEFRHFEGEANLMVWCSWRLDSKEGPLASSDDESGSELLVRLIGLKVTALWINISTWDLILRFGDEFLVNVFCDHLPGNPSYDGNWYLTVKGSLLRAGPGDIFVVNE